MASGTWEDFTDKYGFNDGSSADYIDALACEALVRLFNAHPAANTAGLRAINFTAASSHNPVRLVVLPAGCAPTDDERFALWESGNPAAADHSDQLPDDLLEDLGTLIADAYAEAWRIRFPPLYAAFIPIGDQFTLNCIVGATSPRDAYRTVRRSLRERVFTEHAANGSTVQFRWPDVRKRLTIAALGNAPRGWSGTHADHRAIAFETLELTGPTGITMTEEITKETPS